MIEPDAEIIREKAEKQLIANLTLEDLRMAIKETVADGFKRAMTVEAAEQFWAVGIQMLQTQARNRTGEAVLGGLRKAWKVAFWGGMGLLAVYMVAGWHGLVTVFKVIFMRE